MARSDRTGNRKPRNARKPERIPEMGYYLIVTDTEETELSYFTGLYGSLPEEYRKKITIKVVKSKTENMVQKCIELMAQEAQYRIPWIVFDRDKVRNFDDIIKDASCQGIHVGWSNPCFEIWMWAYYGSMPSISQSWICCSKFGEQYEKKTGIEYSKSDPDIYRRICQTGDEGKAIQLASQRHKQHMKNGYEKPSEMIPCSTVYELVGEIRHKIVEKEADKQRK